MSRLRKIAEIPAGSWTKWVVVGFWVVVLVLAFPALTPRWAASPRSTWTCKRAVAHDRNLIIPLILVVVFVILGLLLRALVAPLILIATVVLSFAAALGVSAFFFNHVFGFGGADTTFPLFVFVFLVALGIDYNIFLMTRVREEAIKRDARHGAIAGLAATGGVITSAGLRAGRPRSPSSPRSRRRS